MQRSHAAGCPAYRLRHWIRDQVESGEYVGLAWEDRQRTTFRIPWKHASKREYNYQEDAAIFKAWAIFKGKYREDGEDRAEASTWKTRLRCALNKSPDFEEVIERSRPGAGDAYKVYRILPEENAARCDCSRDQDETMPAEGPEHSQEVQEVQVSVARMESIPWLYNLEMLLSFPDFYTMDVRFFYKGALVSEQSASRLCRVGHRTPAIHDPSVYGPGDAALLLFPPPAGVMPGPGAARQRAFTEGLLDTLERGVLLRMTPDGLFAERLCRAHVFWSGPCAETPPGAANKMERGGPVQVFDTMRFVEEINRYVSWQGPSPQFMTTICFGEEFPDTEGTTKYVTVQVEARFARLLYDKARAEGACSLREFEISAPDKEDELVDILKSLCDRIAISS